MHSINRAAHAFHFTKHQQWESGLSHPVRINVIVSETEIRLTRDVMLNKMANASATGSVTLTIGGSPTMRNELGGAKEGTNIVFRHTTIDGGEHLFQILCWTLKSR